jgi:PAS domain-containing protein
MTSLPIALANGNEQFLLQAFHSFAEAADSLERSYGMLRSEVVRLQGELAESNVGLARSLEENRQMRRHLDRILEGLPCGVLVARANGAISLVNPEGLRLLSAVANETGSEANSALAFESLSVVPGELRDLLDRARAEPGEQEQGFGEGRGERWLAVRHAAVKDADKEDAGSSGADCVSIFILRDISDAKTAGAESGKNCAARAGAGRDGGCSGARGPQSARAVWSCLPGLLAEAQAVGGVPPVGRASCRPGCARWPPRSITSCTFTACPLRERVPQLTWGGLLDWAGGFLPCRMAHQVASMTLCSAAISCQGVDGCAADRHRLEQVLLNLVLNSTSSHARRWLG